MKKKLFLLGVAIVLFFQGFAQNYSLESKIAPEKLQEDFEILWTALETHHPGLYDFTSKVEFDSLVRNYSNLLQDSLTEGQFHIYLREFTKFVKCGHTAVLPSKKWYETIRSFPQKVPVHVFIWQDQLYIRKVIGDSTLEISGSRILSINGRSSEEILSAMMATTGRDGESETMVVRSIEYLFQTHYAFLYGLSETYLFNLEKTDGESVQLTLNGSIAPRYEKHAYLELNELMKIRSMRFGLAGESNKFAVLDLNSFPSKGYKRFYKKMFKQLSEMDSVRLILDLRGNGGGYFPHGNQLLRYLMDEKFTMDFYKSSGRLKKGKHLKLKFWSQFTRFVFSTIPDRKKEDPQRNYQIRYKPIKKHNFDGEVYVITDGWTFSTGSFVASKLKDAGIATVIGEESGGGAVGFNAVLQWDVELTNSGIRFFLPMYHVDVLPETEDAGSGVIPNIPIEYNFEQRLMESVDLEMRYILQGF